MSSDASWDGDPDRGADASGERDGRGYLPWEIGRTLQWYGGPAWQAMGAGMNRGDPDGETGGAWEEAEQPPRERVRTRRQGGGLGGGYSTGTVSMTGGMPAGPMTSGITIGSGPATGAISSGINIASPPMAGGYYGGTGGMWNPAAPSAMNYWQQRQGWHQQQALQRQRQLARYQQLMSQIEAGQQQAGEGQQGATGGAGNQGPSPGDDGHGAGGADGAATDDGTEGRTEDRDESQDGLSRLPEPLQGGYEEAMGREVDGGQTLGERLDEIDDTEGVSEMTVGVAIGEAGEEPKANPKRVDIGVRFGDNLSDVEALRYRLLEEEETPDPDADIWEEYEHLDDQEQIVAVETDEGDTKTFATSPEIGGRREESNSTPDEAGAERNEGVESGPGNTSGSSDTTASEEDEGAIPTGLYLTEALEQPEYISATDDQIDEERRDQEIGVHFTDRTGQSASEYFTDGESAHDFDDEAAFEEHLVDKFNDEDFDVSEEFKPGTNVVQFKDRTVVIDAEGEDPYADETDADSVWNVDYAGMDERDVYLETGGRGVPRVSYVEGEKAEGGETMVVANGVMEKFHLMGHDEVEIRQNGETKAEAERGKYGTTRTDVKEGEMQRGEATIVEKQSRLGRANPLSSPAELGTVDIRGEVEMDPHVDGRPRFPMSDEEAVDVISEHLTGESVKAEMNSVDQEVAEGLFDYINVFDLDDVDTEELGLDRSELKIRSSERTLGKQDKTMDIADIDDDRSLDAAALDELVRLHDDDARYVGTDDSEEEGEDHERMVVAARDGELAFTTLKEGKEPEITASMDGGVSISAGWNSQIELSRSQMAAETDNDEVTVKQGPYAGEMATARVPVDSNGCPDSDAMEIDGTFYSDAGASASFTDLGGQQAAIDISFDTKSYRDSEYFDMGGEGLDIENPIGEGWEASDRRGREESGSSPSAADRETSRRGSEPRGDTDGSRDEMSGGTTEGTERASPEGEEEALDFSGEALAKAVFDKLDEFARSDGVEGAEAWDGQATLRPRDIDPDHVSAEGLDSGGDEESLSDRIESETGKLDLTGLFERDGSDTESKRNAEFVELDDEKSVDDANDLANLLDDDELSANTAYLAETDEGNITGVETGSHESIIRATGFPVPLRAKVSAEENIKATDKTVSFEQEQEDRTVVTDLSWSPDTGWTAGDGAFKSTDRDECSNIETTVGTDGNPFELQTNEIREKEEDETERRDRGWE